MSNSKCLVICGPTSSGKTALALRLARRCPASIISADSRQVYKGLDVLTGKDIPPGFSKDSHCYTDGKTRIFGLDLINPDQTMNAAQFSDYVHAIINQQLRQGRQIVIVGGTGFYLQAITTPHILSGVPPDKHLRWELNTLPLEVLQRRLEVADPVRFSTMNQSDIANPRRLIRALEIALTPLPPSRSVAVPHYAFSWVGLRLPIEVLKSRIATRVQSRLEGGILETRQLLAKYQDKSLPVYTILGVRPALMYLNGEISLDELAIIWTRQEIAYAKRQITWLKKQPQIIWYD